MLFCCHSQLEATFPFKVFCFPAIAVFLFSFFLSDLCLCSALCHWCHAEGVLCHLLLCLYFRHVDPFSLLHRPSPSLSEEDQQPFHNNSQRSSKHCVMKLRQAASVLRVFGVSHLEQKTRGLHCEWIYYLHLCDTISNCRAVCFPDQHVVRCLARWKKKGGMMQGGDGLDERGDYVNGLKRCRVCRSRVSPCGSPSVASAPASSPHSASVPHEWSCFSSTHGCLGEAWSPQTQTKHRQKH